MTTKNDNIDAIFGKILESQMKNKQMIENKTHKTLEFKKVLTKKYSSSIFLDYFLIA